MALEEVAMGRSFEGFETKTLVLTSSRGVKGRGVGLVVVVRVGVGWWVLWCGVESWEGGSGKCGGGTPHMPWNLMPLVLIGYKSKMRRQFNTF